MDLALLALRIVVGLLFVGHGSQKLFGAFGGGGLEGTGEFFEKVGLRPGRLNATAAGMAEAGGGALLVLGLLTPIGAAATIAVMVAATVTVHARNGLWASEGGFEYNLVMVAAAFALAGIGAGAWSLDNALGIEMSGAGWALGALGAGLLGGAGAAIAGQRKAQEQEERERSRERRPHPA